VLFLAYGEIGKRRQIHRIGEKAFESRFEKKEAGAEGGG
jgi:hypothetical protein